MATQTPTASTTHQDGHGHGHPSMVLLWGVYFALIVLTFVTYFTGKMHFEHGALLLALGIACTKAGLVVAIFMHLYYTRGAPLISFTVSILFVLTLIGGVLGDLMFRFPPALPPDVAGHTVMMPPIGYNMGNGPDGHQHGTAMGNPRAPELNGQAAPKPQAK